MIHDVQIHERGANKEVYAKFTDAINTRFNAENEYGYVASDKPRQEDRKNGFRNGVQWVEQELAKMVLAP